MAIFALMMIAIAAVLAVAGCASPTATPVPSPTATPAATPTATPVPTATPAPGNQTVERQYQYVERYNSGINNYNLGITYKMEANSTANAGNYTNASLIMLQAKDRMDAALADFLSMKQYAGSSTEISFSEKMAEVARYQSLSLQNASDAFIEYANETGRPNPNLVRYNSYIQQANHYNSLAVNSLREADALQSTLPYWTPTATP
ncbi:MAG: hypothetical protein A4E28_00353 [Methanocella sp. PtaU1.Bin125]|nr:MAG: hypothetical protein A4E28_00353 [Methanocella sp. PtaU1.Bin125]